MGIRWTCQDTSSVTRPQTPRQPQGTAQIPGQPHLPAKRLSSFASSFAGSVAFCHWCCFVDCRPFPALAMQWYLSTGQSGSPKTAHIPPGTSGCCRTSKTLRHTRSWSTTGTHCRTFVCGFCICGTPRRSGGGASQAVPNQSLVSAPFEQSFRRVQIKSRESIFV